MKQLEAEDGDGSCKSWWWKLQWVAEGWGRYLPSSDEKGPRFIATRHRLYRLSVDDFIWMSYNALKVIQVVHPDILRPEHILSWKSTTALDLLCVNRVVSG
ncbi:hypothetical protein S245_034853 [Arachis hypogaea]